MGAAPYAPPTVVHKTASLVIPAYTPPDADPSDLLGTPYKALFHHDQIATRAPHKNAKRRLVTDIR
ncbi:hypothetical protein ACH4C2_37415 [Streptomyces sp. NPDC018057]|uniref:hypothetical protein n=1 Tax=unclassified Streptomyces TaxID=2593676 RepID=UPI0037ACAD26